MHEFSLAMNIVDIVTEHAIRENAAIVKEVEIDIGELSGVVLDALQFAMESALKGTLAEGAAVQYNVLKGKARCMGCNHTYNTKDRFTSCPKCGECKPEFIQGRELRVKSILVE